jgi:phospholipase C
MRIDAHRLIATLASGAAAAALLAAPAPALAHPATAGHAAAIAGVDAGTPCVGAPHGRAQIRHVIILFMENQPYVDVHGSPDAPYINGLAARCGDATNYHNITHPSAPEYVTVTSGELGGAGDCPPVFLDPSWPPTCPDPNDNIFNQLDGVGKTWKVYEESMATPCFEGEDSSKYDINHNPAAYYTDLGGPDGVPGSPCFLYDVPMGSPTSGQFEDDLRSDSLPAYSFIAPNLHHDTHNSTVAIGDAYLARLLPTILDSSSYRDGSTALFVTWDEGEHGSSRDCAYNTTDIGCHVMMVVVSPYTTPGTVVTRLYNHYSLLRTSELLLGLPLLGHANDAPVHSLAPAFGF